MVNKNERFAKISFHQSYDNKREKNFDGDCSKVLIFKWFCRMSAERFPITSDFPITILYCVCIFRRELHFYPSKINEAEKK